MNFKKYLTHSNRGNISISNMKYDEEMLKKYMFTTFMLGNLRHITFSQKHKFVAKTLIKRD